MGYVEAEVNIDESRMVCGRGCPQDTVLLVAPDTAAQSAQVSGEKMFTKMSCPAGHGFTVPDG